MYMDFMPKTMILSNRKINTDDYNVFRRGVQETYGSLHGHVDEHIGNALRHYGQHLIDCDDDHIKDIDNKSRTGKKVTKHTGTPLFGEGGITNDDDNDDDDS